MKNNNNNSNSEFKKLFYKRLIKFSLSVIELCKNLKSERIFWVIADQLLRSATSIGANIIEAKASSSKRDYINFFQIALKSANETSYWLILIRESDKKYKIATDKLLKEADEISKIIASGLLTLKGRR